MVVALGHPDAVGEALDDGAVAGERTRGVARAEQARGAEEGGIGGGRGLAPEIDRAREVPERVPVVLRGEGLPAALVEEAGAVVAGDVPGGRHHDEHDPEAQDPGPRGAESLGDGRRGLDRHRRPPERHQTQAQTGEGCRDAEPIGRDAPEDQAHVRPVGEDEHEGRAHQIRAARALDVPVRVVGDGDHVRQPGAGGGEVDRHVVEVLLDAAALGQPLARQVDRGAAREREAIALVGGHARRGDDRHVEHRIGGEPADEVPLPACRLEEHGAEARHAHVVAVGVLQVEDRVRGLVEGALPARVVLELGGHFRGDRDHVACVEEREPRRGAGQVHRRVAVAGDHAAPLLRDL